MTSSSYYRDTGPKSGRSLAAFVYSKITHAKRWPVVLAVASLVALIGAGAGSAAAEGVSKAVPKGTNRVAIKNFDPATWKATLEQPLPPMESPITFHLSDQPDAFYDTGLKDLEKVVHTRSLGVCEGPCTVKFSVGQPYTEVQHTFTSLIYPEGAQNMPFVQEGGQSGDNHEVNLVTPGLYAFYCAIHPYMIGAVVVDDPTTPGLDFGKKLFWLDGNVIPSDSDVVWKIVHAFFILEEPSNLQHFARDKEATWAPQFPHSPILTWKADGTPNLTPDLAVALNERFHHPTTLKPPVLPTEPGVGTVYYDTQWEASAAKTKWGSITAIDAATWKIKSKWFGSRANLNHPHNYWTDDAGQYLYSTNWFGTEITTLDRQSGEVLRDVTVGPSPAHVMTRTGNDDPVSSVDGGGKVVELDPGAYKVIKAYPTQNRGEGPALPHGFWVSGNGQYVITPNANRHFASLIDMNAGQLRKAVTGPDRPFGAPGRQGQVATAMTSDGKRAYIASLWTDDIQCISIAEPACPTPDGKIQPTYDINLQANYNEVTGQTTGPYALVPVQIPISPDDSVMLTANTGSDNVGVIDLHTNKLVKTLPAAAGTHGANFGAKKGGGWYGYVTNTLGNKMTVIDADPNHDGNPDDAKVAGEVLTDPEPDTYMDDILTDPEYIGEGGNGIEIYPNAYEGWVQKMPDAEKANLTCQQREPIKAKLC